MLSVSLTRKVSLFQQDIHHVESVSDIEIVDSVLGQYGTCLGPGSIFQGVVLHAEVGSELRVRNTSVFWRCGWEDVDVFDASAASISLFRFCPSKVASAHRR